MKAAGAKPDAPNRGLMQRVCEMPRAEDRQSGRTVIYGLSVQSSIGMVVLFGGPAGAGKSTLARAWCATRPQAAHIELDEIRHLIISGLADPQKANDVQETQYRLSVEATCVLARAFADGGCDVAIDDVFEPEAFDRYWGPQLDGLSWKLVIVLPSLDETLARSAGREKRVMEEHTRTQHARCENWDVAKRIDTTGLDVTESLALVLERLSSQRPAVG